ncbi:hypothetical protein V8C37DRAFT_310650 [Trichoderma ceciliae]
MTKFVGPCKGRCLLVAQNHDLDVETTLASRIYKRGPTRLDGVALHRTISALAWKCFLPAVLSTLLSPSSSPPGARSTPSTDELTMCYFDQTRWNCGYWRWGHFRQQCNKEYRMGETCGLKLVYETKVEADVCKLCHDTEKKQRRYDKMYRDVERWQREGNRSATIERTCGEMGEVVKQIERMRDEHGHRLQSLGQ